MGLQTVANQFLNMEPLEWRVANLFQNREPLETPVYKYGTVGMDGLKTSSIYGTVGTGVSISF